MKHKHTADESDFNYKRQVAVWDLPTRLFHWMLAVLVINCIVTAKIGGNYMTYHMYSGYLVLTFLFFRLLWGVLGGYHSKFVNFLRGPSIVLQYAIGLTKKDTPHYLGHNPLGGWSVVAMLLTLLLQAMTGLFASDDIVTEGPLFPLVRNSISSALTRIHNINAIVIACLIAVHLTAIIFYLVAKHENLIKPMFTGIKMWPGDAPPPGGNLWAATIIFGISLAVVYLIVN
jgi:cytochrome b